MSKHYTQTLHVIKTYQSGELITTDLQQTLEWTEVAETLSVPQDVVQDCSCDLF